MLLDFCAAHTRNYTRDK